MNKIEVKLNIVNDIDDVINPGDAIIVEKNGHLDLIHCCPRCGKRTTTATGSDHVYNPGTKSINPSIVHNKKLGGCGWHGWLINGIFKEC